VGAQLLTHVCREAARQGIAHLSCVVERLDSPEAQFLFRCGFAVEHEEVVLRLATLDHLPQASITPGEIVSLPRKTAIVTFCALYDQIFAGLPWYQPYTQAEVAASLRTADELLFWQIAEQLGGFAWVQVEKRRGVVEPIGILPAYQQQGHGRSLLLASLREMKKQGAEEAQIGAWATNETALFLYQSLGFEYHHSVYYLAKDLAGSAIMRHE
jgi:ribosomal protein S18 acetylase RimI-like enzyme